MKPKQFHLCLWRLFYLMGFLYWVIPAYAQTNPWKNCDFTVDGIFYDFTSPTTVAVTYQGFTKDSYGYYRVSGFTGDVIIPSKVTYNSKEYNVTSVGDGAFIESTVTSVTLPNSIVSIENNAFYDCRQLTTVNLPEESLTTIGNDAFDGCTNITSIILPEGVTSIGSRCFSDCRSLTSITIPNSVKTIGFNAFSGCTGLTSVNLSNGLTAISGSMFYGCSGLTSIIIPNSVTSINSSAFSQCSNLASIVIPSDVTNVGSNAFNGTAWLNNQPEGMVYVGQTAYMYKGTMPDNTQIVLKNGTKGLADNVFAGCKALTSVVIPSSVTTIGQYAFSGCTGLANISIPSSVININQYTFYNCTGLTTINIANGKTHIGASAFNGCTGLTAITNIGSVDNRAFSGCTNLTSVSLSQYAESIGDYAFAGCSSLVSVHLSNSLTSIGEYAFNQCTALKTITIPKSVNQIYATSFQGCKSINSVTFHCKTVANWFSGMSSIQEVVMGDEVEEISPYAFQNCSNLASVTIPESVESIGQDAFYGTAWYNAQSNGMVYIGKTAYKYKGTMPANTSIMLKDGTESIASNAFYNCTGLTAITIPQSVTDMTPKDAFYGCTNLTSIKIAEGNPKYDSRNNCNAIIDKGTNTLIMGCKGTIIPDGVTTIGEYAFRYSGLTSITIPNSVTNIEKNAFYHCSSLSSVTIGNNVKVIGYAAFCENGMTSITIPNSVTTIEDFAFQDCKSLLTVNMGNNVTSIGNNAFNGTAWLNQQPNGLIYINHLAYKYKGTMPDNTEIVLKEGTTTLNTSLFSGCTGLSSVSMPSSVTTIGTQAFYNCKGLTSISLPSSLVSIGNYAFNYCTSLASIDIPDGVRKIGIGAFSNTAWYNNQPNGIVYAGNLVYALKGTVPRYETIELRDGTIGFVESAFYNGTDNGLTSITIPNTVTSINSQTFYGCKSLMSITIPSSVTSIGYYAFGFCSSLLSVVIPECVTSIGENAFDGCNKLTEVFMENPNPLNIEAYTFTNRANATLYVPAGSKTAYEATDYWKDFKEIVEMAPSLSVINFADPTVKTLCVMYWDTNGDLEVDTDEAAAVTSIGTEFQDRANITSFEELEYFTSVTRIAESAFSDCTNLSSIKLPKGLMTIGSGAFMRCSSLASITIPSTVASIGNMPFAGCNSLSSIIVDDDNNVFDSREDCNAIIQTNTNTLRVGCKQTTYPESVSAIGNYAFAGCTGLTTLNLPNSVTSIGTSAYNKCSNLTSIVMPKSVTNIGSGAFSGCDKLENIVVDSENLVYDSRDNCNAIINTADNTLIAGCKVTQIPNSITIIGESAFLFCSGLTSIEIPEGVTSIKSGAFNSCGDLVSVTIPSSIISIGANAFDWCNALVTVYNYKTEPIRITSNVFPKRANATLYVPAGCKEAYEAANVWKDFKEIVEMEPEPEADTDISQMDNAIYIEPLTGCAGSTVNLQVKLKNVQAATSYGFELVLPEGMSIDVTNDGSFDEEIKLSSRHSNHTLTTNKQADGSYKVAVASLSSKSLADNDGTILNIKSHIADDMALGDYPILVQKPLIVYSDGTKPTVQDVRTRITIEDYTIGDVDGDYVVDLADAVLVINYYVGKTVSNFNAMAADVDGDGIIDLADAVKIINYYVGKIPHLSPTRITKELDPQ